jgi:hypothetical protein
VFSDLRHNAAALLATRGNAWRIKKKFRRTRPLPARRDAAFHTGEIFLHVPGARLASLCLSPTKKKSSLEKGVWMLAPGE